MRARWAVLWVVMGCGASAANRVPTPVAQPTAVEGRQAALATSSQRASTPPQAAGGCGALPACRAVGGARPCCIDAAQEATQEPLRRGEQALFEAQRYPQPRILEGVQVIGHEYRIPALSSAGPGRLIAAAEKRYLEGSRTKAHDSGFIQAVYRVLSLDTGNWGPERVLCTYRPPGAAAVDPAGEAPRAGATLPGTCGNPTLGYDSKRRQVVALLNGNDHDLKQPHVRPGERRVLITRSRALPDAGALPDELGFGPPRDITAEVTSGLRLKWDAVGPGAAVEVKPGRLAFSARKRIIFAEGDALEVALVRPKEPMANLKKVNASEATLALRNDGTFVRNGRTSGLKPHPLMTFRRIATFSRRDSKAWTPYTTAGQPLTPGHFCSRCGHFDELCPPAAAKDPQCRAKGIKTGRIQFCHAALARLTGTPGLERMAFTGPGNSFRRFGMEVRLSYDEGESWPLGRWLVPLDRLDYSGYSSAVSIPWQGQPGIAVVYERAVRTNSREDRRERDRKNGPADTILFDWVNIPWVLCGRKEPVYIAGNRWLGRYDRVVRQADGRSAFTSDATGVTVVTNLSTLADKADNLQVRVQTPAGEFEAQGRAHRGAPGVLSLDSGWVLRVPGDDGAAPAGQAQPCK